MKLPEILKNIVKKERAKFVRMITYYLVMEKIFKIKLLICTLSASNFTRSFLHRKGATPAEGPSNPNEWMGKPVIIPGSMGSASYLLTGCGNDEALDSACHGAGRLMPRGEASHIDDAIFDKETEHLRLVTPIDPKSPQMQMRKDILKKIKERIKEEAPYAYKPITPVIESVTGAGIARVVVKLMPMCTVKG